MDGCSQMPPKTGWLFYLDEKWRDAEALRVTVNSWDGQGISEENSKYKLNPTNIHNHNFFQFPEEEDFVTFVSNGAARDSRKAQLGDYTKTSQMIKGLPVFEQAPKQDGGKQYFLFVGQDGCWRVGPDMSSYSGSVLKHPKKNKKMPPKAGWLYYLDDKWNEDESLQLITKNDEPGK